MRICIALGLATALAACAINPAEPVAIRLTDDELRVRMSDGSRCIGRAPPGEYVLAWRGALTDCPWPYAYTVEIDPRASPLRYVAEAFTDAVGLDDLIAPVARVGIVGANGRERIFTSPNPVDADDDAGPRRPVR